MKGFTESYIVPKDVFDQLSRNDEQQVGGKNNLVKFQQDDINSSADFMNFLAMKRQKMTEDGEEREGIGPVVSSRGEVVNRVENEASNDERVSRMFQPTTQPNILQILNFIRQQGDAVMWNPKNFEVTIYGKHYPGSNIVDMLHFLLVRIVQGKKKVYPSEYKRGLFFPADQSVPKQTDKLYNFLKDSKNGSYLLKYFRNDSVTLLESNQPMLKYDLDEEKIAETAQTHQRMEAIEKFRASFDPDSLSMGELENKRAQAEERGYTDLEAWLKTVLDARAEKFVTMVAYLTNEEVHHWLLTLKKDRTGVYSTSPVLDKLIDYYQKTLQTREHLLIELETMKPKELNNLVTNPPEEFAVGSAMYKVLQQAYVKTMEKVLKENLETHQLTPAMLTQLMQVEQQREHKIPELMELIDHYHYKLKENDKIKELTAEFKAGRLTLAGVQHHLAAALKRTPPQEKYIQRLENIQGQLETLEKAINTPLPPESPPTPKKKRAESGDSNSSGSTDESWASTTEKGDDDDDDSISEPHSDTSESSAPPGDANFVQEVNFQQEKGDRRYPLRTRNPPDKYSPK